MKHVEVEIHSTEEHVKCLLVHMNNLVSEMQCCIEHLKDMQAATDEDDEDEDESQKDLMAALVEFIHKFGREKHMLNK